jgi:hypothetical protein
MSKEEYPQDSAGFFFWNCPVCPKASYRRTAMKQLSQNVNAHTAGSTHIQNEADAERARLNEATLEKQQQYAELDDAVKELQNEVDNLQRTVEIAVAEKNAQLNKLIADNTLYLKQQSAQLKENVVTTLKKAQEEANDIIEQAKGTAQAMTDQAHKEDVAMITKAVADAKLITDKANVAKALADGYIKERLAPYKGYLATIREIVKQIDLLQSYWFRNYSSEAIPQLNRIKKLAQTLGEQL